MLFLEGQYSNRCREFTDPKIWLGYPHQALDLACIETAINATAEALDILLCNIDSKHFDGAWLDICSGNGIAAIHACWPRGIDLLHIDQNAHNATPLRSARIAWLMQGNDSDTAHQRSSAYIENNFLTGRVEELVTDPSPIFSTMPKGVLSGAMLLNPDSIPDTIISSIRLTAAVLPKNAPFIITTDPSDTSNLTLIQQELDCLFSSRKDFLEVIPKMHGLISMK